MKPGPTVKNYKLLYGLLAVTPLLAAVLLLRAAPAPSHSVREDCGPAVPAVVSDADLPVAVSETVLRFTRSAILRQESVCAWDLASSELRLGAVRESWRHGAPLPAFKTLTPGSAVVEWVAKDPDSPVKTNEMGEPEIRVYVRVSDTKASSIYELALVYRGSRFQVSYAQPPFG
jgi:hypothetical protein